MEIIIGQMPPLKHNSLKTPSTMSGPVEARLLHVRPPRKGVAGPLGMERRGKEQVDPLRGRVLTVMVPDSESLPSDLDTENYKVILRFQKM